MYIFLFVFVEHDLNGDGKASGMFVKYPLCKVYEGKSIDRHVLFCTGVCTVCVNYMAVMCSGSLGVTILTRPLVLPSVVS